MQHANHTDIAAIPVKKRKIDAQDTPRDEENLKPLSTNENTLFIQIIMDAYPANNLVKIDPLENEIIYKDLIKFESSGIKIEMCLQDLESLYKLDGGKVWSPARIEAWNKFVSNIVNSKIGKTIELNQRNMQEIQKARWFMTVRIW